VVGAIASGVSEAGVSASAAAAGSSPARLTAFRPAGNIAEDYVKTPCFILNSMPHKWLAVNTSSFIPSSQTGHSISPEFAFWQTQRMTKR